MSTGMLEWSDEDALNCLIALISIKVFNFKFLKTNCLTS